MRFLAGIFAAIFTLMLLPPSALAGMDSERLKETIASRLIEGSPWKGMDAEAEVVELAGYDPSSVKFDRVEVNLPRGMRNTGKVTAGVVLYSGSKEVKRLWASARIRVYRTVAVSLSPLKMNKAIDTGDVKYMRTELADTAGAVTSEEEIKGMSALRPIPAGMVIKKEYLRPETLIKRGEAVTILVDNGRLRIKSKGKASEDGYMGKTVRVRAASGKEIKGRVTGRGEMTVNF